MKHFISGLDMFGVIVKVSIMYDLTMLFHDFKTLPYVVTTRISSGELVDNV